MKLNGALKPRQGASKQGSSPGVVQREYRIKRYNKVNENVVKDLPLNNCGVNNKNFTLILNNSNNIYIKKQQKQQPLHREQISPQIQKQEQKHQQQQKECGEIISSYSDIENSSNISISLCSNNFSSCTKNKSTTIAKNRFSSIAEKPSECTHLSSYINNNKLQSITTVETEIVAKYYKTKINNEIDLKQRTAKVNNITTRQVKNTKINKENSNNEYYNNSSSSNHDNKNKNNSDTKKNETKTKQVKVVKTKLTSSKYHVIVKRNRNRNNSSGGGCGGYNHYRVVNNKFLLLIQKIYENLNLTFIISRLFIQLKLLLFLMFSHAIKHLTGNPFTHCSRNFGGGGGASDGDYCMANALDCQSFSLVGYKLAKIMRASITLGSSFERNISKNMKKTLTFPPIALCLLVYGAAFILLPQPVIGDDGDNFFPINGIETTTPEFDYASRGQKKFGDKCENTLECGFPGSICDTKKKSCQCTEDLPVTNHIDKCGKEAAVNESCFFNEQCEMKYFQTECRDQKCVCRFDMTPVWLKDGSVECKGRGDKKGPETYIDPAMIGVLIGMALMFIIICVVLRLFSQARWRENRTIFNTPNPRLMNVSLLRESKLLHGQERRGSRMSVRAPSRQPSMASLRPHSPNPSLGKTGRMTRSKSNTRSSDSRVSDASNCSRLLEHHTASTHHASHIHANTTAPHASTTNHGPQASVSPISINAPTTTITYANQTPVAGNTTCSSNLTTPPPTITNKPNKF